VLCVWFCCRQDVSRLRVRRRKDAWPSRRASGFWFISRPNRWSGFRKLLAEPDCLVRQARIVPSIKNGKPRGFKLYAIRSESLYSRLGLKNGDLILKLNGHEMTTPDKALEAFASLKMAKTIAVELERRGKPRNHTYLIKE
jgi:type II secretion system protein C